MANYKKIAVYALSTVFFLAGGAVSGTAQKQEKLSPVAQRLQNHVKYLASDKLGGRFPGTTGDTLTREYLINFFKGAKIDPGGSEGTYEQTFTVVTGVRPGERNAARLHGEVTNNRSSVPFQFELGLFEDYTPLGFSKDTSISAEVVFAGFGISAPDEKYDDYEGLDVAGKAVIVFRGTPDPKNPHSAFGRYSSLRFKAMTAREKGAAAIIFITPKSMIDEGKQDELMPMQYDRAGKAGVAALHLKREAVNRLLAPNHNLNAIEDSIVASGKPFPIAMRQAVLVATTEVINIVERTSNIIGIIEGTDAKLKGQYIVVGAHIDHLGDGKIASLYTGEGKHTHYGADDNASGTASIMEIASRLKQKPLRRSVLIMGFGAEEMGLLGSAHYVENPTVPLDSIAFMLNLDMVGRMKGNELQVGGTGTSPAWDDLLDSLKIVHKLSISKSKDGSGSSDHASFYKKDIPVLFLFTGLHEDYHRPSDTWDKINYEGQARIVAFGENIARIVGNREQRPQFSKVETTMMQGQTRGFSVWVGTIPDYADHPDGMRITGAAEGSPAQEAGLQEGDVIIKFGDTEIKNIYDYTYSLGNYKPGDKVEVVVLRNGDKEKVETLTLTLRNRGGGK